MLKNTMLKNVRKHFRTHPLPSGSAPKVNGVCSGPSLILSSKFHENLFSNFSVILPTNQPHSKQMDRGENKTHLGGGNKVIKKDERLEADR